MVQLKHYIISDDDESLEEPELYFEYVPQGSLLNFVGKATTFQQEQATVQILWALAYLHGQLPEPVVHRDLKLDNVLVQAWGQHRIHIKLADFGLSNRGELLQTFCGTLWYLAPEGYTKQTSAEYGPLVDIWSLGVLVFLLVGGEMPEYLPRYNTDSMAWARAVVRSARAFLRRGGNDDDLLAFAIEYMLVPDHGLRRNVWQCLDGALRLKSVAEAECCGSTDETGSLAESDGLEDDDESGPSTPKALQSADQPQLASSSNASTIRALIGSLGERGDEAVDARIGMEPSSTSSFERLGVSSSSGFAPVPAAVGSMLEGALWRWPALEEGEVVEDEKEEDGVDVGENGGAGQAEIDKSRSSFEARLHLLREVSASLAVTADPRSTSHYKRPFWDDHDRKSETNDERPVIHVDGADIFGQAGVARQYKKARW